MSKRIDTKRIDYYVTDMQLRKYKKNTIHVKLSKLKKEDPKEYLNLKIAYEIHKMDGGFED